MAIYKLDYNVLWESIGKWSRMVGCAATRPVLLMWYVMRSKNTPRKDKWEIFASLAYLITMTFALANREKIAEIGAYFEARLNELCAKYPEKLTKIEGAGLLAALHCKDIDSAKAFMNALHDACIDASAQIYKQNCLPAVLFKPSLISDTDALDFIANAIDGILAR